MKDAYQLHADEVVLFLTRRGQDGDEEEPSASPVLPDDERFESLVDPARIERVRTQGEGRGRQGIVLNLDRQSKRKRLQLVIKSASEDGDDDGKRRLPLTRGDCVDGPRPCPHVGCRHHLYLDTQNGGNLRLAFKDLEPGELEYSCSLDIADGGPRILDEMATVLGVTRERTRQIFENASAKLRKAIEKEGITREDVIDIDGPESQWD